VHLKANMKGSMIQDIAKRHPDLVQDLLRICVIQASIHLMLYTEGSETLGNRGAVALLLYTCLGVLFYHLIAKTVFGGADGREHHKTVTIVKPEIEMP